MRVANQKIMMVIKAPHNVFVCVGGPGACYWYFVAIGSQIIYLGDQFFVMMTFV